MRAYGADMRDPLLVGEAPEFDGTPLHYAPGDYGYKHDSYHPIYQEVFGKSLHCTCGDGECRATDWRPTELHSPAGYDIIAYRKWEPLPKNVWMPPPEVLKVWPQLLEERAHICAYESGSGTVIPCAIINVNQT
jgi:hypothetical protein